MKLGENNCAAKCRIISFYCFLYTFSDLEDAKSRSLDNLGRVYARTGDYEEAIQL